MTKEVPTTEKMSETVFAAWPKRPIKEANSAVDEYEALPRT